MFGAKARKLKIKDLAELWSTETHKSPSVIETDLISFIDERRNPNWNAEGTFLEVTNFPVTENTYVDRDDIRTFCEDRNIKLPRFWFSQKIASAAAESECEKWLSEEMKKGPKQCSKAEYLKQAKAAIGSELSDKAFNRVWKLKTPDEWRRSGRPPKSKR